MALSFIGYVTDWQARLRGRLYAQFADKPNFIAIANLLGKSFQELEDAFQSLLSIISIDDSSGINLDVIGYIVRQLRLGFDDPTFRLLLKARIRSNKSSGTPEDLYGVFKILTDGLRLRYTPRYPASFDFTIRDAITDVMANIGSGFLRDAKMAGVKGVLLWQEDTDDQTFTFGTTGYLSSGATAGNTTITLSDTSMFPASGTATIEYGTAVAEDVTFTVAGPTTLTVSALANNHDAGATVELDGDDGQGFAEATAIRTSTTAGDGSLAVNTLPSGWPSSGSVIVDDGLATAETLAFTSTGAGPVLNLSGTAAQNHDVGASVTLVGTSTGGSFTGALVAAA